MKIDTKHKLKLREAREKEIDRWIVLKGNRWTDRRREMV